MYNLFWNVKKFINKIKLVDKSINFLEFKTLLFIFL